MENNPPSLNRRLYVFVPTLILSFIASFFYFVLFPGTTFGNAFYTGIKIWLLVWPAVAVIWILKERPGQSGEKRHRASLLPGTVFGLLVVGLLFFLLKGTPMGAVVTDNSDQMAERIRGLGVEKHFLWFALFISFAHAALEEYYWRWFAFGQARKLMSVRKAHLVAAAGFASHHIVILSQFFPIGWALFFGVCVGIGGAVWSWLYQKYNSLWGAWVSHMIVDLGLMWIGWEVLQAVA